MTKEEIQNKIAALEIVKKQNPTIIGAIMLIINELNGLKQILDEMFEGSNFYSPAGFEFYMAIYCELNGKKTYTTRHLPYHQVKFIKLEKDGKTWYKVSQIEVEGNAVFPESENFYLKKGDMDAMLLQLCDAKLKYLAEPSNWEMLERIGIKYRK